MRIESVLGAFNYAKMLGFNITNLVNENRKSIFSLGGIIRLTFLRISLMRIERETLI